jgi:tetratricopeptide (TPR) repeat protein
MRWMTRGSPAAASGRSRWRRRRAFVCAGAVVLAAVALAGWIAAAAQSGRGAPGGAEASLLERAGRAIAHGRAGEAEALARAAGPDDPVAAAVLARLAGARGRDEEALALLEGVAARHPSSEAALELGLLYQRLGRKAEAARVFNGIVADAGRVAAPADLARVARAARALGQVRSANALYREALAGRPGDPAINTAWGELFLEKHQFGEAATSFRAAIERDPEWAPAHLGLAQAVADEDPPAAAAAARRALEIDPNLADAHVLLAELALDERRRPQARALLDRALAINPRHLRARALVAALAYVEGQSAAFEAEVRRLLAINPVYGDVYRVTGALLAQHYRFDEAVAVTGRALELEPDNVRAAADLGMHLLRTGDEREARRLLERAFRADPYDTVTFNLLQMLDALDKFESIRAGAAVVRIDPAEAPVLREYAVPIVEAALAQFGARYGLTPRGPILVEIFPKHDDFAVRNLGLPGLIGALGACFGRVVTLDSPRARKPGTFNWQATLWHELAHVFTLQMSQQRVPRWLTEGISVYEEGRVRPAWARDAEVAFARAYDRGEVLPLEALDAGFTRPETIGLAYFQAYLVVEFLVDRYGEPALHALVRAFADGIDTDAAFTRVLGTTLAAIQPAFDARLGERFGAVGRALRMPEGVALPKAGDVAAWRALAAQHRDSFPVQLAAGQALAAAGDRQAATAALERAAALVPTATGPESPRALLAALAEQAGDGARARRELAALLAYDHTNLEAARRLAALADAAGDEPARRLAYEHIVTLDPFDAAAHTALGRLALAARDVPLALREFRAALAAGPVDPVAAHCDLGEAYLAAGQRAEAKREALAALEIAPTYERAQELLLKAVEGSR